jgi:hypothetical protein
MVALTVTAMLAVAFAPISLFFLITAPDYNFFTLLNVFISRCPPWSACAS